MTQRIPNWTKMSPSEMTDDIITTVCMIIYVAFALFLMRLAWLDHKQARELRISNMMLHRENETLKNLLKNIRQNEKHNL